VNLLRILITGGCGFIGSNIAVSLIQDGHVVTCFDNLSRRGSEALLQRILAHNCAFAHGDIRNIEDLMRIKGEFDVMIECSAEPSVLVGTQGADAAFMVNNNLVGSLNCYEVARQKGMSVLFFSTSRVYPYTSLNALRFRETETRMEYADDQAGVSACGVSRSFPLDGKRSLYGATKLASELILQEYSAQYQLPSIINRCGVIAGPWQLGKVDQGVFTFWLTQHYFKKSLRYIGFGGKGKQVRDLLHIEDLCALVKIQLAQIENFRGEVFNVGGSTQSNLSLAETTAICQELTGNHVEITASLEDRPADLVWYLTDNAETEQTFGWYPERSATRILEDIYVWLRENEATFTQFVGR
jgi:CDP-paratose 2-epimerase